MYLSPFKPHATIVEHMHAKFLKIDLGKKVKVNLIIKKL